MGVGCILRVSWVCLLLCGGSLAASMKGYNNPYTDASRGLGGFQEEQLVFSPSKVLSSYGQATGYADRSYRSPVALQINWDLFMPHEPLTFPLNPTYKTVRGSNDPHGGVFIEPSTQSSKPGSFGFPSSVPSFDPVPHHQFTDSEVTPINSTLDADPVSSIGGYGLPQHLSLQFDRAGDAQGYSPNFEAKHPSSENAQLPSKEVGPSNYNSDSAVQPSSWLSRPFESKEVPVFSSDSAHRVQAAPIETPAFPSYGTHFVLDSMPSKGAAQPGRFRMVTPQLPSTHQLAMPKEVSMPFPYTYIVQSRGRHGRGRNVNRNTRYYKKGPPPASFGLKRQRRWKL
ncbi:uncharacterized protein LOC115535215 [Gadus morhua]|uniref:uncharacterized protein LOC115535215 n=1 Tax=Gadus morhua TaxID=8049 RepID=UPI0011B435FE|nr:uncharacterized protein LOC115535215 [Gadus morhua]